MDAERRAVDREAARGDPDARVRVLVARLRSGELDRKRLELACVLGDAAARAALGPDAPPADTGPVVGLALSLKAWGPPAFNRAGLALARWVDEPLACVLREVKRWLEQPDEARAAAVLATSESRRTYRWDVRYVGGLVNVTGLAVRQVADEGSRHHLGSRGEHVIRTAIAAALIPWALGDGDPALEAELADAPLRWFSATARYVPGETILHQRFGQGEVRRATASRVVVRFADRERPLELKPGRW